MRQILPQLLSLFSRQLDFGKTFADTMSAGPGQGVLSSNFGGIIAIEIGECSGMYVMCTHYVKMSCTSNCVPLNLEWCTSTLKYITNRTLLKIKNGKPCNRYMYMYTVYYHVVRLGVWYVYTWSSHVHSCINTKRVPVSSIENASNITLPLILDRPCVPLPGTVL